MMTPLEIYHKDISERGFETDEAQLKAVRALDRLFHDLLQFSANSRPSKTGWRRWFQSPKNRQKSVPKGIQV